MSEQDHRMYRMKQILLHTRGTQHLDALKRMVRNWRTPGAPGQDGVNRALIRAVDELHNRLDALLKI